MPRSVELEAVLRRLLEAFQRHDADVILGLVSNADDTLVIGSDPREWLYGTEARHVTAAQAAEMPDFELTVHRLEAHDEGPVGWAAASFTVEFIDGTREDYRLTAFFRLERGVWRVAQWHASIPKHNRVIAGVELTTSLNELVESLDADARRDLNDHFQTTTVTLMFSDIEESTQRTAEMGDQRWTDLVRRHFTDIERIAGAHGGIVVKTLGDGAMLAYESARSAAQSAVAIQQAAREPHAGPLHVRVGVHTGDAVHSDGDYLGQAVNKAARIAAAAGGGQVLVSDVVRGLVDRTPGLVFGEPLILELKGLPGSHIAYALEGR